MQAALSSGFNGDTHRLLVKEARATGGSLPMARGPHAAQPTVVNYLRPFFCSSVFVSVCVLNVWPRAALLPVWPGDAGRGDTPQTEFPMPLSQMRWCPHVPPPAPPAMASFLSDKPPRGVLCPVPKCSHLPPGGLGTVFPTLCAVLATSTPS